MNSVLVSRITLPFANNKFGVSRSDDEYRYILISHPRPFVNDKIIRFSISIFISILIFYTSSFVDGTAFSSPTFSLLFWFS